MHAELPSPDKRTARREYHLLLTLNLVLATALVWVVLDYLQSPDMAARIARVTRGGPLWTGLLAGSLALGWADVLIAPTLRVRRELHPEPFSWRIRRAS